MEEADDFGIGEFEKQEPDLIRRVTDHLPGVAVVRLRTNFRSTPEVRTALRDFADSDVPLLDGLRAMTTVAADVAVPSRRRPAAGPR